jgi:hypothetical protein
MRTIAKASTASSCWSPGTCGRSAMRVSLMACQERLVCSSPSSTRVEPRSLQVSLLWWISCHDLCVRLGQAKGSIAGCMVCFLRFHVCCNLGLWLSLPLNEILATGVF